MRERTLTAIKYIDDSKIIYYDIFTMNDYKETLKEEGRLYKDLYYTIDEDKQSSFVFSINNI